MNCFKQLLEEDEKRMSEAESERILNNIWGASGFLDAFSDAAERYITPITDIVFGRVPVWEEEQGDSEVRDQNSNVDTPNVQTDSSTQDNS